MKFFTGPTLFVIMLELVAGQEPDERFIEGGPLTPSEETMRGHVPLCELVYYGMSMHQKNSRGFANKPKLHRLLNRTRRMVRGDGTDINDAPFTAMYGPKCNAVIIGRMWLVTTASCGSDDYSVLVGSSHRKSAVEYKVCAHYIHPQYKLITKKHRYDYNYQLLLLVKPLVFSHSVNSISIANGQFDPNGEQFVGTVYGWGTSTIPVDACKHKAVTNNDYEMSEGLKSKEMLAINNKECSRYGNFHKLTERLFCAFTEKAGPCQGDSGSPFVSEQRRLVGIVSYGSCGCENYPSVFSALANKEIQEWLVLVTLILE